MGLPARAEQAARQFWRLSDCPARQLSAPRHAGLVGDSRCGCSLRRALSKSANVATVRDTQRRPSYVSHVPSGWPPGLHSGRPGHFNASSGQSIKNPPLPRPVAVCLATSAGRSNRSRPSRTRTNGRADWRGPNECVSHTAYRDHGMIECHGAISLTRNQSLAYSFGNFAIAPFRITIVCSCVLLGIAGVTRHSRREEAPKTAGCAKGRKRRQCPCTPESANRAAAAAERHVGPPRFLTTGLRNFEHRRRVRRRGGDRTALPLDLKPGRTNRARSAKTLLVNANFLSL